MEEEDIRIESIHISTLGAGGRYFAISVDAATGEWSTNARFQSMMGDRPLPQEMHDAAENLLQVIRKELVSKLPPPPV